MGSLSRCGRIRKVEIIVLTVYGSDTIQPSPSFDILILGTYVTINGDRVTVVRKVLCYCLKLEVFMYVRFFLISHHKSSSSTSTYFLRILIKCIRCNVVN